MDERSPGSCAPEGSSPGAASWYAQHADPTFVEACYAAAPPRIRAALERLLAEAGLRASVEPVGAIYWSAKARKA
jgi:hypothetical protein